MKNILYLSIILFISSCSYDSTPSTHSETKSNLKFSFTANKDDRNPTDISVSIDATFTNVGSDTLYFYERGCSYWAEDLPVNLHPFFTGVKCIDTLPKIVRIAPKKSIHHRFEYYVENETDLESNTSFGVMCYPVSKNFKLTPESTTHLKNTKSLTFKPGKVKI